METRLADEDLFSLRTLTRFRTYLVESISDLKRKVVCVLDQVFPEYQSIFSNIFEQVKETEAEISGIMRKLVAFTGLDALLRNPVNLKQSTM